MRISEKTPSTRLVNKLRLQTLASYSGQTLYNACTRETGSAADQLTRSTNATLKGSHTVLKSGCYANDSTHCSESFEGLLTKRLTG